jgi:hypothetical protein
MSEGLKDEAWKTTWGLYHVIYETKGYWFRTPEAWDITGNFRAGMYMRPTAIWALEMTPPSDADTHSQSHRVTRCVAQTQTHPTRKLGALCS